MLATFTNTPQKLDASFMAALGRLAVRYPKAETTPTPEPVISGIETPDGTSDSQDNRPTESELNANYLISNNWQRIEVWLDPKSGLPHLLGDALRVQSERDASGWSVRD